MNKQEWLLTQIKKFSKLSARELTAKLNDKVLVDNPEPQQQVAVLPSLAEVLAVVTPQEAFNILLPGPVVRANGTDEGIGMAVGVFGEGNEREIGPEFDGALKKTARKGVVHNQRSASRVGRLRNRRDVDDFQFGFVGDSIQTSAGSCEPTSPSDAGLVKSR